jgi:putative tryptophan/tyrosine transport system substrate-binding protein
MKRRAFFTLLGGAASWPLAARAQQPATPVIGVLLIGSLEVNAIQMAGLKAGLGEQGFVEGQNVAIETRSATTAQYEGLLAPASELVHLPVAVLVATGSAGTARAAKAVTTTTPIVFANGSDPVSVGLVASINRPSRNATGVTFYTSALGPKRLEILHDLVPNMQSVALLVNPTNPVTQGDIEEIEAAARKLGMRVIIVRASNAPEIVSAFEAVAQQQAHALLVNVDAYFSARRVQIVSLAAQYSIPASYNNRLYVHAGGLISYGDDRLNSYRQVGAYVGRILKGEKPSDLPVMQPTKFELVINLKTAKALGLDVPPTLLARADEVIE